MTNTLSLLAKLYKNCSLNQLFNFFRLALGITAIFLVTSCARPIPTPGSVLVDNTTEMTTFVDYPHESSREIDKFVVGPDHPAFNIDNGPIYP